MNAMNTTQTLPVSVQDTPPQDIRVIIKPRFPISLELPTHRQREQLLRIANQQGTLQPVGLEILTGLPVCRIRVLLDPPQATIKTTRNEKGEPTYYWLMGESNKAIAHDSQPGSLYRLAERIGYKVREI